MNTTFIGNFANWTRFGEGNLTWRNGDQFTGQWVDDHTGNGTIHYSDGTWFDNNHVQHCIYFFIFAIGTIYIGQWKGDKRHGHGEMRSFDTTRHETKIILHLRFFPT